jgi:hypothetical protein
MAAAFYVVLAAILAIASLDAGAWVRATIWAVSALGFGVSYGITLVRLRRA